MDADSPWGSEGRTVQDRINELVQQRSGIRELTEQTKDWWQTMSEQDWISYRSRWTAFGEEAALRWLLSKNGGK